MSITLPLRFLFRRHEIRSGDRVLVIQSGAPALFTRVVDAIVDRYPSARLSALVGRGAESAVQTRDGVEYIASRGADPTFVRELRARRFDHVFVMLSDDPGYWKLKALPLALDAAGLWAVNENLDCFPIDVRHSAIVAQHMRRRLESSVTFAGAVRPWPLERVGKLALYPAALAYLWSFERVNTLRARVRGAPSWKRDNRPARQRGAA